MNQARRVSAAVVGLASLILISCVEPASEQRPTSGSTGSTESRGRSSSSERTSLSGFDIFNADGRTEPSEGWFASACGLPLEYLERIERGIFPDERSPDLHVVPEAPHFFGSLLTTSHSGPWDYVQNVPLVFYGPGHVNEGAAIEGDTSTLADLAPTVADLLRTPFPSDRPGRVIDGVAATDLAAASPRLVLQVVWDGGGWDVLETWPEAWPNLKRMMENGSSVIGTKVGSSPSVTPPIHTTMGTGAFPSGHGITNIPLRRGEKIGLAFPQGSPENLELQTFADIFDARNGNVPKVGMMSYRFFHLGMMGQGAYLPKGDKDIAVIAYSKPGALRTNEDFYRLPGYLQRVGGLRRDIAITDATDGQRDGMWHGKPLKLLRIQRHSPVWVRYQTRLLQTLIREEGFGRDEMTDLLYVNFKQIDAVGHWWNMLFPATETVLRASDNALGRLEAFLDRTVGKRRWVMVLTADHGQVPGPTEMKVWPIQMQEMAADVAAGFGLGRKELFPATQPTGFFLDESSMSAAGITPEQIADALLDYQVKDNADELPAVFEDQADRYLFAAAIPVGQLPAVLDCARAKSG